MKKLKVVYPGPAVTYAGSETYHPDLGKLIAGKMFNLDSARAIKYIKSGLLRPATKQKGAKNGDTIIGT